MLVLLDCHLPLNFNNVRHLLESGIFLVRVPPLVLNLTRYIQGSIRMALAV